MKEEFLSSAPPNFKWPRCPDTERFIVGCLDSFLQHHPFSKRLADRLQKETSTDFLVWVDHLVLPTKNYSENDLKKVGFVHEKDVLSSPHETAFWHPFADLPRLILSSKIKSVSCAIKVDYLNEFQEAHHLSLAIHGAPLSTFRSMRLTENGCDLVILERRGTRRYEPDNRKQTKEYLWALETWISRPRTFEKEDDGMKETLRIAKSLVKELGPSLAATVFLEGERDYWQKRNQAGQIQKSRQDTLGMGWANHDHHTFRSSRPHFPALIEILMTFGFKKRERFYAGAEAGWGAQVMENPEAGLVIFADVDLTPDDVKIDFSSVALKELDKPGTVGLWCALHGESILQAGMHHLEAQFNFDHLRDALRQDNVETMPPFSDFTYLRQAFTKGEQWMVDPKRLDPLLAARRISKEAYDQIKEKGAVGSHLENLQRHEGFKGFNQSGVSQIIQAVNPEKQALDIKRKSA